MKYNLETIITFDFSDVKYKELFDEIDNTSDEIIACLNLDLDLDLDTGIFGMLKNLIKMNKYLNKFKGKHGDVNMDAMIELSLRIHKMIILFDTSIISRLIGSNVPFQCNQQNTCGMRKYTILTTSIVLEIPDEYTVDNYKDIYQDKFGKSYDILRELYGNDMVIGLYKKVDEKMLELLTFSFTLKDMIVCVSNAEFTLNKYQDVLYYFGKFFDMFSEWLTEKKLCDEILKKMDLKKYKKFYKKVDPGTVSAANFKFNTTTTTRETSCCSPFLY